VNLYLGRITIFMLSYAGPIIGLSGSFAAASPIPRPTTELTAYGILEIRGTVIIAG
jgi:hypothetical protein